MELKKAFLGQSIFVKSLNRNVEVCEENKYLLSGFAFLFDIKKPIKDDGIAATKSKSGKRGTKSNANKS